MTTITNRVHSPIGVDVDAHCFKAFQLETVGGAHRSMAATVLPRAIPGDAPDPHDVDRLRGVLERQGFMGDHIVLAAPRSGLFTAVLELPPRNSGAPIEQLARAELAQTHGCNPDEFEMAHWDVPAPTRAGNMTHIVATACLHDIATQWMDVFESAGLVVAALDVPACALARACTSVVAESDGINAILELGWRDTQITLVRLGTVVYQRQVAPRGVHDVRESLNQKLPITGNDDLIDYVLQNASVDKSVDPDNQLPDHIRREVRGVMVNHVAVLADEVQASLSFAAHRYSDTTIEGVLLTGAGAALPDVAELMNESIDAPVRILTPTELAPCDEALRGRADDSALVVSLGLALHGMT